jgi:dTDP-4-dehydrorhamnose reductase
VAPLNMYGRGKVALEQSVLECLPDALIIRTSAFLDGSDPRTFSGWVMLSAGRGERIRTTGEVVSPTYVPALADTLLDLLIDGERGVWHLANAGAISWTDLALRVVEEMGCDRDLVEEATPEELGRIARRPPFSALTSERGAVMPTLDESLDQIFQDRARALAAIS